MNAITKLDTAFLNAFACEAPQYVGFNHVSINDVDIDSREVRFMLSYKGVAATNGSVLCSIIADEDTGSYWVNHHGNNPEYDQEIEFASLAVTAKHRPTVEEFEAVFACHGLQIQLTDEQIQMLNDEISEILEEQFKAESEKEAAEVQDLADESRYYEKMGN